MTRTAAVGCNGDDCDFAAVVEALIGYSRSNSEGMRTDSQALELEQWTWPVRHSHSSNAIYKRKAVHLEHVETVRPPFVIRESPLKVSNRELP